MKRPLRRALPATHAPHQDKGRRSPVYRRSTDDSAPSHSAYSRPARPASGGPRRMGRITRSFVAVKPGVGSRLRRCSPCPTKATFAPWLTSTCPLKRPLRRTPRAGSGALPHISSTPSALSPLCRRSATLTAATARVPDAAQARDRAIPSGSIQKPKHGDLFRLYDPGAGPRFSSARPGARIVVEEHPVDPAGWLTATAKKVRRQGPPDSRLSEIPKPQVSKQPVRRGGNPRRCSRGALVEWAPMWPGACDRVPAD